MPNVLSVMLLRLTSILFGVVRRYQLRTSMRISKFCRAALCPAYGGVDGLTLIHINVSKLKALWEVVDTFTLMTEEDAGYAGFCCI